MDNEAEFFYGRSRNYLWRFLPTAFGKADLKGTSKQEKLDFIKKHKIDLTDLIEEIKVEEGQQANYYDSFIDNKVTRWKNIIALIDTLPNLKGVCFTRRTFTDIPQMKKQLLKIQKHCDNKGIAFQSLTTPARFTAKTNKIMDQPDLGLPTHWPIYVGLWIFPTFFYPIMEQDHWYIF